MTVLILSNCLLASVLVNALLTYKIKQTKKERPKSYEVKELMADLAAGGALVEIRRIDPSSIFLRSPREKA